MTGNNLAHYQKGNQTKIAFVFSCPGQEEEKKKCPASGKTGDNLNILIRKLNELNFLNKVSSKNDLRITNSWDKVLYDKKDGRTEASLNKKEIYSDTNLLRIRNELNDIDEYIICSGTRAMNAICKAKIIKKDLKIIQIPHIGLSSLNRNKNLKIDIHGNAIEAKQKDANERRIELIANNILKQLSQRT